MHLILSAIWGFFLCGLVGFALNLLLLVPGLMIQPALFVSERARKRGHHIQATIFAVTMTLPVLLVWNWVVLKATVLVLATNFAPRWAVWVAALMTAGWLMILVQRKTDTRGQAPGDDALTISALLGIAAFVAMAFVPSLRSFWRG